ncbi:hypothetical protein LTR37_000524 [Vermiconidia calcicola]|uniref:Uncharacterized protein n=1 Tax=Vermiconidia calcicola TaxID=1690605 RepID=A0ACC3P0N1_9PEZI|nr:hypothetical protein LTR37_000524 [Vermiconidia calcicola]
MAIREKAKNLFKSKRSRGNSLAKTDTSSSDRERYPSNVYKPGESMPRPKYRAPPKKEHTEKLEAFDFAEAWRKKSFQSNYSPMGTRAPSRRSSWFSVGRKSVSGRSEGGRTNSVGSGDGEKGGVKHREGIGGTAVAPRLKTEPEAEGDDDVTNVGMSRVQSYDKPALSRPRTADDPEPNGVLNGLHTTNTITARDHQPFTAQDLELAMSRTRTLQVPSQS